MPDNDKGFVSAYQAWNAMQDFWNAWCTCQINVLYHRRKAARLAGRLRQVDVWSLLLAGIAGLGVLAGFKTIPETV